ncbi:MAG: PQQ-binding-like beta-propeller repeat protein, partial [Pirellulaceae bacterium]
MNAVRLSKMVVLLVGTILTTNIVMAADWPRFRGPDCTGISPETGLVQEIPEAGLPLLWQIEGCGTGYSSVSIVDGKIFTMGDRPDGDNKSQFVIAFDLAARKELWATKIGPKHDDGSRCTPTIDGDRLYALGTDSDLVCLDVNTGE